MYYKQTGGLASLANKMHVMREQLKILRVCICAYLESRRTLRYVQFPTDSYKRKEIPVLKRLGRLAFLGGEETQTCPRVCQSSRSLSRSVLFL